MHCKTLFETQRKKNVLVSLAGIVIRRGRKSSTCALCGTRRPGYPGPRSVQDGDDFTN